MIFSLVIYFQRFSDQVKIKPICGVLSFYFSKIKKTLLYSSHNDVKAQRIK